MPIYTDKRTGRLYVEFQYKGTRVKERLPEGTRKIDAEKVEIKIKNELMFQSHGVTAANDITFEKFLKDYFAQYADRYSPDTFEKAVYVTKAALPFFRGKLMRSIKADDIERFKRSRIDLLTQHKTVRKPATVEREMSIISRIFSLAVKNDICPHNPCSRVDKIPFDNVQDRVLSREDEARFIAALPTKWSRDIVQMVLNTGLRQNDLMTLTRFEVDRTRKIITLIQGKTKRRVTIPMNDLVADIIESRWRNGHKLLFPSPVTKKETGSVRHTMQRVCKRIGIPSLSIRDLRRTFATRAIENGWDAVTVADILGHTGLRMIPRYVRSIEQKRKLVESMTISPIFPPEAETDNVQLLKRKG